MSNGRWEIAPHLELLDRKLIELAARKIRRLIVTMPPRHGKSQLCSRYFPAWYIGKNPDHKVILCSYEANFAADWGAKARDILEQHGRELFNVTVRHDSSARDDWKIVGKEGGMVTAGVGGPITGRGADLLIIDDPIKNAAEANSETFRQRVWDWWLSTALTRVEPDGVVLLIMTRWHELDLVGQLLKQNADGDDEVGEQWHVLNLPAIAEHGDQLGRPPGEALWPARWPLSKLTARMKRLGSYVWNALFQQRPAAQEGNLFKRAWLKQIDDHAPRDIQLVRHWDLAATKQRPGSDPDYAAGVLMGMEADSFYIIDIQHFRDSPQAVEQRLMQTARSDGVEVPIRIEQEPGSASKLYIDSLARKLPQYDVRGIPVSTDKVTRARPFSAACERGSVHLVRGQWIDGFIEEICTFPHAAHDDRVDAATGAYNALARELDGWEAEDVSNVLGRQYND